MRGFLIFLVFAAPVVLFNPLFWWIVESYTGAAPSMIVEADGATRETFIGPRSPWPKWTLLPERGTLTPASYYGAAPGHAAMGFGDVTFDSAPKPVIGRLIAELESASWSVSAVRYRAAEPSLPPTYFTACMILARRTIEHGEQTAMYNFQLEPALQGARVHWIEGPPLSSWPRPDSMPEWMQPQAGC